MSIFMIEQQVLRNNGGRYASNVETFCDTLEEAIGEIEYSREYDTGYVKKDRIVFDGPITWQGDRRYLLSWEKENSYGDTYLFSYIIRELDDFTVAEARKDNDEDRLLEWNNR